MPENGELSSYNSINDTLNENQRLGVETTEGPLLILAGAGSGKTRVLTHRIAYLMRGKGVAPYHIMAITFTNKAAGEMRERVNRIAGDGAEMVWVATFHSTCVRILRRFADRIGFDSRFTIFDSEDQKTVMKEVIKKIGVDPKMLNERFFLNRISMAKNELIGPESYPFKAAGEKYSDLVSKAYREYQSFLANYNAMDFDDLLFNTVALLKSDPEVLSYYQRRFSYIMVDEYQDTNTAQFAFIDLLAKEHNNICVVGDDDQSIYRFRGANIRNILDFEAHYPQAKVIRLEQNYRSRQAILDVANSVISHNKSRKVKSLWTDNKEDTEVEYRQFEHSYDEAGFIANDIAKRHAKGLCEYRGCAVLYRTNAQSRLLEEKFLLESVPYRVVGGVNFYGRKEIKDILSYLRAIDNSNDDISCRRIINVPKRGIGGTTVGRITDFADKNGISFFEALRMADEIPGIGRSKSKIEGFRDYIDGLRAASRVICVSDLIRKLLRETEYEEELKREGTVEAKTRMENIDELIAKAVSFEEDYAKKEEGSEERSLLSAFLEDVALIADIDRLDENDDYVTLMTLHSAKGLEFDEVYLSGLEEGLFPSSQSINSDSPMEEIEEERRLCYVGITRAKKRLVLSSARSRMLRGENRLLSTSRFVKEIPKGLISTQKSGGSLPGDAAAVRKPVKRAFSTAGSRQPAAASDYQKRLQEGFSGTNREKKLDYVVGDTVSHRKFGSGEVLSIADGGRDFEVSVRFSDGKVRKMFAAFANLTKV